MKNYYATLLLLITLNVTFAQTVVNPISATTSFTPNFGTDVTNAYNGNGLNTFPSLTSNHQPTSPANSFVANEVAGTIDFNLGANYDIDSISFWNQNDGGPDVNIGINSVLFYASTDGVIYTPISGAPTTFAIVTATDAAPESFTFPAVNTNFIRMEVVSNHGAPFTGFAEIAFSEGSTLNTQEFTYENIKLYPNPANSYFKINGLQKTEMFKVYNILGTEVLNGKISNKEAINISNLQNGLYLVKIGNNSPVKIIKK